VICSILKDTISEEHGHENYNHAMKINYQEHEQFNTPAHTP
jgi:hypothetical protein